MIGLRLLAIFALVVINGFFAAAEFSLVAVRLSRVRQLAAKGSKRAVVVERLAGQLDRVVSGVQVGITLTSLGLGALGELTLAALLRPMVEWLPGHPAFVVLHAISLALAFALLTMLHVVLGELVPKSLSLQRAERVALLVALPFDWYLHTFRWAIGFLDGASRA
ncbi:MAG: CNNM domain-containing protein, partial [Candidatus Acidiferrales bacterium]